MALPLQKFREIVFQLLYSNDFADSDDSDMTGLMMQEHAVTKKNVLIAQERMRQILIKKEALDELIQKTAHDYAFERIPRVERNLLRLGIFELMFDDEIPPKVAIAEAMRLCRKFATPEGAAFVNAILDQLFKKAVPDGHGLSLSAG
jgi:N utilization substance protein B